MRRPGGGRGITLRGVPGGGERGVTHFLNEAGREVMGNLQQRNQSKSEVADVLEEDETLRAGMEDARKPPVNEGATAGERQVEGRGTNGKPTDGAMGTACDGAVWGTKS